MFLDPLLEASPAIQFHVATVVPAAVIGAVVLIRRKGTPTHRLLGKVWVLLMVATAFSTFFIHTINMVYGFSPIHLLSILVIVGCVRAVVAARNHDIRTHRRLMRGVYAGGIVGAGFFTLYPGRIMHQVIFGVQDVFRTPGQSRIGWLVGPHAGPELLLAAAAAMVLVFGATALWLRGSADRDARS